MGRCSLTLWGLKFIKIVHKIQFLPLLCITVTNNYHGFRAVMVGVYCQNYAMCINVLCGQNEDFVRVMLMQVVHTCTTTTAVVCPPHRVGRQHAKFTAFTGRKLQNVGFIQSLVHGLKCRHSYMAVSLTLTPYVLYTLCVYAISLRECCSCVHGKWACVEWRENVHIQRIVFSVLWVLVLLFLTTLLF